MWGIYTNIFIISIKALLYSNPLIQLRENNIYNLTQPNTSHTPWTSKRHALLRNIYVIRHDRSDVRGWSLKQLPKLAIMTTIAYKTHVLQRFTDLHWRQAYLAAEAGDDVGGGEIDGLLVFAGLAVAGGDEFACKVWGLIGAVAGVELRSFLGDRRYGRVRPIPADCRDSF